MKTPTGQGRGGKGSGKTHLSFAPTHISFAISLRLCYNSSRNHNFYAGGVPMPHFTESLDALRREAPARFLETDQFAELSLIHI